jgi:hypothetical protein
MFRASAVAIYFLLSGCSRINIVDDGRGLCRSINEDYPESLYLVLEDEVNLKSPNGYLTEQYSRKNWNEYWNNRVFYMWDIGPDSCGGTYDGPVGPEIINLMLLRRKELGLHEIEWDGRNIGKEL